MGRWHVNDPLSEKYYSNSPYNYVLNRPLIAIDPDGMRFKCYDIDESGMGNYGVKPDVYYFDEAGNYVGKTEKDGEHTGVVAGKDGEKAKSFNFADPVNDPKAIEAKIITQVVEASDDDIATALEDSGVNDSENQENKYEYAEKESDATNPELGGTGKMDYVITTKKTISSSKLYITTTKSGRVAHNSYNYGNFLWGGGRCCFTRDI